MELKDILAISGHSGLFKFVSQGRQGIIVEGVEDKKRMPAYTSAKISTLDDIAVFTEDGELKLAEILKKIREKENGGQSIDPKSGNEELKKYFAEVVPNYDYQRVYVSDIKKIISWYNILQRNEMLDFTEPEAEEVTGSGDDKDEKKARDTSTKSSAKSNKAKAGNMSAGSKVKGDMNVKQVKKVNLPKKTG